MIELLFSLDLEQYGEHVHSALPAAFRQPKRFTFTFIHPFTHIHTPVGAADIEKAPPTLLGAIQG